MTGSAEIVRLDRLRALAWEELGGVAVLLPVGSTEQHGPHMPLGTDTALATAVCEAACRRSADLVLAPAVPFGVSDHHTRLPGGAVSAGPRAFADYLVSVISDLVDPARRRAVVVVNGHGGNWSSITFALDVLGTERGELPVGACNWWELVPELMKGLDPAVPEGRVGHAGALEASALLAVDPSSVDLAAAPEPLPLEAAGRTPRLHRWLDFARHFPTGVIGTPGFADAELGRRLIDLAGERLAALASELHG
jgi:creatinine amidohydrolase